jgi:hypothetical protein
MDDAALRETARAAIDPEELENLIRLGDAMIERAKELVKAAEAAIHASEMVAIEARQTRAGRARLRGANLRLTDRRTDPYETS